MQMSEYCMNLRISFISHTDNGSYSIWLTMRLFGEIIANYENSEYKKSVFALSEYDKTQSFIIRKITAYLK